jgi:hypothetical protein
VIDGHPGAGHELFDLAQDGFFRRRTEERGVIGAGKFHQPGVGDMSGEIPCVRDRNPAVLHGVYDQGRGTDGGQDRAYIDRVEPAEDRADDRGRH